MGEELEVSNAVLAEKLDNLEERLRTGEVSEKEFHARVEAKLETLTTLLSGLQTKAAVNDSRVTAVVQRQDAHDKQHTEQEKASRFALTILVSVLTAGASIASAAVALLLHG